MKRNNNYLDGPIQPARHHHGKHRAPLRPAGSPPHCHSSRSSCSGHGVHAWSSHQGSCMCPEQGHQPRAMRQLRRNILILPWFVTGEISCVLKNEAVIGCIYIKDILKSLIKRSYIMQKCILKFLKVFNVSKLLIWIWKHLWTQVYTVIWVYPLDPLSKASKLLLHNDKFDLVNTLSISYILIPICLGDL